MWKHSRDTITENNFFVDVDRAIAYGLVEQVQGQDHTGGVIRNNAVYYTPGLMSTTRKASADAAIIAWDSPNTKIYHNTILTNGNLRNAIEFHFPRCCGEARNNLADAPIASRNGTIFTAERKLP